MNNLSSEKFNLHFFKHNERFEELILIHCRNAYYEVSSIKSLLLPKSLCEVENQSKAPDNLQNEVYFHLSSNLFC